MRMSRDEIVVSSFYIGTVVPLGIWLVEGLSSVLDLFFFKQKTAYEI